jgi:hypothetical protein
MLALAIADGQDLPCVAAQIQPGRAAGSGTALEELPNASLGARPHGARDLVELAKRVAVTIQVSGAAVCRRLYLEMRPTSPNRIVVGSDGVQLLVRGLAISLNVHARSRAASPRQS